VRRLSYIKIPVSSDDEFSFTVQAETLKEVRKLCEKYSNVDIILTENENQIVFRFENTIFFSKLLEDEFPDYLSIIPDNFVSRLVIPTDKFRDMLKMARPVANAASVKSIIVKLENSQLGIKAEAEEQGEFETFYQVVSEGDNAEINFNIEYIMQAVDICETDKLIIDFNGATRPAVIREENNDDYVYIVMPLRG
ncbi:MAG: hypothetical protein WC337_05345, partial [Candidatus Muiribacteriota bacterium]